MTKDLYVVHNLKSTGIDEYGNFAILEIEVRADTKKTIKEIKIYLGGRTWFSNTHEDYAYSVNGGGGKVILLNTKD